MWKDGKPILQGVLIDHLRFIRFKGSNPPIGTIFVVDTTHESPHKGCTKHTYIFNSEDISGPGGGTPPLHHRYIALTAKKGTRNP